MLMFAGLFLLSVLSLGLAFYWYRRVIQIDFFVAPLLEKLGEPDTSGTNHYTDCGSHVWMMKNVVHGDYLKSAEGFRNFMMNRTMIGVLILSVFLGLVPMVLVYLLFQSYQLIGTSLVLVILSIFVLRGPGELEISNQLFLWLIKQEQHTLTIGDLAYTKISKRTIENWIQKLLAIGIICICLAPWGESVFPAIAYAVASFIGYVYTHIFVPVSMYSMSLALIIFFAIIPSVLSIGIYGAKSMYKKSKKDNEDFIS
ncbi:MAG: hypothetical protein ACFFCT_03510 [Candidatus Odinarchaeota archaeon]